MEPETVAVLLFSATVAVMVGYAARTWSADRSRRLANAGHSRKLELRWEGDTVLQMEGRSTEEQEEALNRFLKEARRRWTEDAPIRRTTEYAFETDEPLDPAHHEERLRREEEATGVRYPRVGASVEEVMVPEVAKPRSAGLLSDIRMIHLITMLFLLASFWIILSKRYDDDVQKWAFGAMGSILGFWLGPGRG